MYCMYCVWACCVCVCCVYECCVCCVFVWCEWREYFMEQILEGSMRIFDREL
jgi:hypothetical protein